MQYRELGKSGIKASAVGLGAWAIGGWMWGGTEEKESVETIKAAMDAGINLIDTAPVYGFGLSEEIVGRALKGVRERAVLATKCGLVWDREEGEYHFTSDEKAIRGGSGDIKVFKYLSPVSIRSEIEMSLRRIGTDYIDLYQTHWQDATTPVEDTMNELLKLKQEGKIRAIGVSNAGVGHLESYLKTGQIDADQESYSMLDRKREKDNIPYCEKRGIAFLAYSPLARGLLTGKVTPDFVFNDGDHRRDNPLFSRGNRIRVRKMLDELSVFAEKYDASFAQLAVAWTFHQQGCTHALAGARRPGQAMENAKAGDMNFGGEDLAAINKIIDSC
ncbi:MAG: aldo/keto reductase [Candidatus Omnitrophica bacterium]|nr:aldo/keto reductase [Candidatus Omnitrophota bacterium]